MSQSTPGQSHNQQASSQALLDELRLAADRARDERLKLARLFKHTADLPVNGSAAIPTTPDPQAQDKLDDLTQRVERLGQYVAEKLDALDEVQRDIDSRTQYLESLRHTITDTTRAFVTQVEQAQHFKAHVDAAKQHVKMAAGRVVEDIREHLAEYEAPIADRLKQLTELDEQIDKRIARMQQMHKQASDAVDKHLLGALRTAKEQAADMAAPVKAELDKHLQEQAKKIEEAIQAKIADLDVDVEEALSPLTDRFDQIVSGAQAKADELEMSLPAKLEAIVNDAIVKADELAELLPEQINKAVRESQEKADAVSSSLPAQIEEAILAAQAKAEELASTLPSHIDAEITAQMDKLRETVASQAQDIVTGMDDQTIMQAEAIMRDRIAQTLDNYLNEAEQEAGGYVDGLIARLDEAREQAVEQFESALGKIAEDRTLDQDAALRRLDEEVDRLHAQAQQKVANAQEVLEQAVDGVHGRVSLALDAAIKASHLKLDEHQSEALMSIRAIDEGIDDAIETSRQRVIDHEKTAQKQSDEAMRMVESGIAAAQQRLAGFEAGISQRIGLAIQTSDDAISSVDSRLDQLEQDAAARVSRIVDLAETSGQAVADSIDALAQSAEQTAAKAQQDLEEKLLAFEAISSEALKQAESTLRTNIGELRDASRAMIEVVAKQVKAQASHIEPQTREVIEQAEQTLRRRIGELREGAQSMVDLAVARLEGQLDEVKRKAQHAAFQGVDPAEPNKPSANDAA
ncbi:MAG: hypothetical protein ACE37H_11290 [Phycisphaeraceae bacterium]